MVEVADFKLLCFFRWQLKRVVGVERHADKRFIDDIVAYFVQVLKAFHVLNGHVLLHECQVVLMLLFDLLPLLLTHHFPLDNQLWLQVLLNALYFFLAFCLHIRQVYFSFLC